MAPQAAGTVASCVDEILPELQQYRNLRSNDLSRRITGKRNTRITLLIYMLMSCSKQMAQEKE